MIPNRRQFLTSAAMGGAALSASPVLTSANETIQPSKNIKLAVATYCYWQFRGERASVELVIDKAAELGVEGVDVLHRQMSSEENSYLQELKLRAFRNGVALVCLSIHQDFVSPDEEERQRNIDHTIHCIELAHAMGIPSIRLNSGRWGTIPSFNDLMDNRGLEPPLEGYTEDDAFDWCIDSIEKCLPAAERNGVHLALENHWGLTRTAEGVLRIRRAIDSPWLGVLMDTGNFLEEPYEQLEMMAPYTTFVQAKTYYGGGRWYTLDLDYDRIAGILRNAGYSGFISLEFEGNADPDEAVPQSFDTLRRAFGIA